MVLQSALFSSNSAERKVLDVYRSLGADIKAVNFPDSAMYPVNLISIIQVEIAAASEASSSERVPLICSEVEIAKLRLKLIERRFEIALQFHPVQILCCLASGPDA